MRNGNSTFIWPAEFHSTAVALNATTAATIPILDGAAASPQAAQVHMGSTHQLEAEHRRATSPVSR